MKKPILLLLLCLLPAILSLRAQDRAQIQELVEQSKKYMYSNPKQASYCAAQAASLFPNESPNAVHAEAMLLYCQAEQLLGNFDLSIKTLYDTKKLINPTNKKQIAQLHSLMGRIYSKLGDYNKAIELNDKATSAFKSIGDSSAVAKCYNERGVMHHFMNEFQVAEQFFRKALAINRAQRNLKEIATNLNNLCLYQGNTKEKLSFIKEAIAINKNLDAQWSLGENYNNMAKQYYYSGQFDKALKSLHIAYEYAYSIGARELICDNYEYASMIYAAIGDYAKAYQYLDKMYVLGKELQGSNKLRNIEQDISYKEIQDQKHAAESREQMYKIELLKRNLWLLGCVLLLGVAVGIFLYKGYKRRNNLQLMETRYRLELSEREVSELRIHQQELELKSVQNALEDSRREVTSFAVFLRSRNELLDKIRDMIKDGYKMSAQNLVPHLMKINACISQFQKGDKTNSTLLLNIEEKNNEFLQKLLSIHPKLTQGEKYLATLLRVNLSTKEISMLTGTTPKTINMNRYRLRKSLNLSTEDDLTDYLQNI